MKSVEHECKVIKIKAAIRALHESRPSDEISLKIEHQREGLPHL